MKGHLRVSSWAVKHTEKTIYRCKRTYWPDKSQKIWHGRAWWQEKWYPLISQSYKKINKKLIKEEEEIAEIFP